ncbi:MAG: dephospho-CoA kinase [Clostridia bacterium]|nr:dephospho-CoA kinase [Clostridia bacterium]
MKVIGVTGGIGSGKSTVTKILSDFGAEVIDADIIAWKIVEKGQEALQEIVKHFGEEILTESGELNRKKLGNIVFSENDKLESLNRITHKYIIERIIDRINSLRASEAGLVVVDAAIPFRHGFLDVVQEVWVVIADMELRIKRVMDRNGLTYNEVHDRIMSQKSDEEYMKLADKVIINNGSAEDLVIQVKNYLD